MLTVLKGLRTFTPCPRACDDITSLRYQSTQMHLVFTKRSGMSLGCPHTVALTLASDSRLILLPQTISVRTMILRTLKAVTTKSFQYHYNGHVDFYSYQPLVAVEYTKHRHYHTFYTIAKSYRYTQESLCAAVET